MDDKPISFRDWSEVLGRDATVPETLCADYRRAIVGYLGFLKSHHRRATVASVLKYLAEQTAMGRETEAIRVALRWFFIAGRKQEAAGEAARMGTEEQPADPGGVRQAMPGRDTADPDRGYDDENPPPGEIPDRTDRGDEPWERRLVERIRVEQKLWRTEQTYRAWCRRFAAWLAPRTMGKAGHRAEKWMWLLKGMRGWARGISQYLFHR